MTDTTTQAQWQQLAPPGDKLLCIDCTAARLLLWDRSPKLDLDLDHYPAHAITLTSGQGQPYWLAVHCDYFKRRVEHPARLRACGARKTESTKKR